MVCSSFSYFHHHHHHHHFLYVAAHRLWLCALVIFIPHSTLFIHFPFRHLMMDHLKIFFLPARYSQLLFLCVSTSFYGNCKRILFLHFSSMVIMPHNLPSAKQYLHWNWQYWKLSRMKSTFLWKLYRNNNCFLRFVVVHRHPSSVRSFFCQSKINFHLDFLLISHA